MEVVGNATILQSRKLATIRHLDLKSSSPLSAKGTSHWPTFLVRLPLPSLLQPRSWQHFSSFLISRPPQLLSPGLHPETQNIFPLKQNNSLLSLSWSLVHSGHALRQPKFSIKWITYFKCHMI